MASNKVSSKAREPRVVCVGVLCMTHCSDGCRNHTHTCMQGVDIDQVYECICVWIFCAVGVWCGFLRRW